MTVTQSTTPRPFFGWRVVAAAFLLAFFGWGFGFYGPPVFLHAVRESRGWSVALISAAITTHYLVGALTVANLPAIYARFGHAAVTMAAALCLGLGFWGWAVAFEPWQLFAATILSGSGWAATSAAGVNAIISPWFVSRRVAALGLAYNGASIGGLIFSPLWVALIGALTFPVAVGAVGAVMIVVVWLLAALVFAHTPESLRQTPDGAAPGEPAATVTKAWVRPLPGRALRKNRQLLTLAAGMALGLFAQIGLVSHLFSLLVPALGARDAGILMGVATGLAMAGRMIVPWLMPANADRRVAASINYAIQILGSLALLAADGDHVPLLLVGTVLFGFGIGNATSLPPLIAQVEFVKEDVGRAVALIVATSQAVYAFSPAFLGLLRDYSFAANAQPGAAPLLFAATALVQALAIAAILAGRRRV
ncbi:MAG: MFS transporter [Hyphomicrobiaceae bacterium]